MTNRFTRAVSALTGLVLAGSALAVVNAAPAAAHVEDCPKGYFCAWTGDDADGTMWKTNKNVADLGRWADDIHSYTNNRETADACLYAERNYDRSSYLWYTERADGEAWMYYGENSSVIRSIKFVQDPHECDVHDYPSWASSATSGTPDFGDLDGDTRSDVVSRDRAGRLWFSPGSGQPGRIIGTGGWNGMSALTRHGDFSRDGREDVIARETATGKLYLYPGTGSGGLGSRKLIGTGGWNGMRTITAFGDLTGDGRSDLVATEKSTGKLYLYPGTSTGTLGSRKLIGTGGWNAMNALVGMGDTNGDGWPDLYAREASTGKLWLYPGTSTGTLGARKLIGTGGWNTMGHLLAVGDFTVAGAPDLIAVTNDSYREGGSSYGAGWQITYAGRGDGRLGDAWRLQDGWWGFTAFC
ncbi:FG-GAP-like repeat-containing protein [Streptomyces sp. PU10]|uniref:FG-GAP-like repeat-containing protein n=1 Tax=unclassified Streptomyces TaxID=2593676 RepID=UPI00158FE1E3|nr:MULTISPECIES: FG-GAP-like repeat-containing protein [unclassified Streptomyces]MDU0255144.1 FG-GAP-like repeat-containing protein [Streptomyces sp. PU10]QKW62129.1 VCBS repeat-containing protein [Streptomyces sp. NA03103]